MFSTNTNRNRNHIFPGPRDICSPLRPSSPVVDYDPPTNKLTVLPRTAVKKVYDIFKELRLIGVQRIRTADGYYAFQNAHKIRQRGGVVQLDPRLIPIVPEILRGEVAARNAKGRYWNLAGPGLLQVFVHLAM